MDDQRQGHSEIGRAAATCSDSQTGWVDSGSPEVASENFASYQKDQARPSYVGHSSVSRRGSTVVSINISKDAPIDVGVSRLLLSTRATGGK